MLEFGSGSKIALGPVARQLLRGCETLLGRYLLPSKDPTSACKLWFIYLFTSYIVPVTIFHL